MYQLEQTGKFKKDIKLAKKRGLDMRLLDEIVTHLVKRGSLPQKNKPHKLTGNYKGFWECHIQPDWLLVWEQDETIRLITLSKNRHAQRLILTPIRFQAALLFDSNVFLTDLQTGQKPICGKYPTL